LEAGIDLRSQQMEVLALHIRHLDDGPEANDVLQALRAAGLSDEWRIERPSEATNALWAHVEVEESGEEGWRCREAKLDKAVQLLGALDPGALRALCQRTELGLAMRIHSAENFIPLSAAFVQECGRLGLEILVVNEAVR